MCVCDIFLPWGWMLSKSETSDFEQCKHSVLLNSKRRGVLLSFLDKVSHCFLKDFRSYAKVEFSLLSNLTLSPKSFSISLPSFISSWVFNAIYFTLFTSLFILYFYPISLNCKLPWRKGIFLAYYSVAWV